MLGSPLPGQGPIARRRTLEQRRRLRRHAQTRRLDRPPIRRVKAGLRFLGLLLALCVATTLVGLFALDQTYKGRILPNVAVRGQDVSQMAPTEARHALQQRYAAFMRAPITFEFAGRAWTPTPEELGVSLELDTAVERAYRLGRGFDMSLSLFELAAIWRHGVEVPLHVTVDQSRLQAYLQELAADIEQPPVHAALSVHMGQVVATPARAGRQLLVDATLHEALVALQSLQPQTITLRTRLLQPTVEDAGIAEARQRLETLLQSPITLTAGEQQWTWTRVELGTLVHLQQVPRTDGPGDQIVVSLDEQRLAAWLRQIAAEFDTAPIEPRLRFTTSGLQMIREGRNGARLEIEAARDQLAIALWGDQRTLALPVTTLEPRVRPETLASLGIVELVGQGKSSFLNSAPYRVTNIQAGARQMDGVLIAPGAEFSFNNTVGAIDESNGFTQGYAIIDGRTQQEWGGGVCQVSTTVFRAAYWGGLPITERNQHSFRISWYEKFEPIGMDAAIFTGPGGYDLRFVNDTGHWLLIEAYADTANEVLTINLYGTNPGREVVQIPPEITRRIPAPNEPRYINDPGLPAGTVRQTDVARGGMDVRVGRIVRGPDGTVLYQDTFFSRFKPWPNIFVRGTG